ncbi:MAG: oligopeptide transporter, OPT family [Acidobacteriota bacterium]
MSRESEVEFQPHVPASESPVEATIKAVAVGIFFGIAFGAANAYLGLLAGLTISTSIPVAVLSVGAFRILAAFGKKAGILEANLAQTVGSASSSVASGVIFTLPALFLWELDPSLLQMTLLALAGGLLGVLFMVPLRRFLIAKEHGKLPYPEGTACAEVLVAADRGGATARNVFLGLGVGAVFKFLFGALKLLPETVSRAVPFLPKAELGLRMSSALFGVGFILGPRIGAVMVSGSLLAWLVIIPGIAIWGGELTTPFYPETELLIAEMSASQIWNRYVRYIGAGAVACAGILTLIRSLPTMIESIKIGIEQMKKRVEGAGLSVPRTDLDLPLPLVGLGAGCVALMLAVLPQAFGVVDSFSTRAIAALLVVIFAFFFVTVSSRIVGLVGQTSNPTSGMTIASLLGTAAIFLALGWTDDSGKVAALTVGAVVAIAASISGDTSQDLKTGFLLGATPRIQQLGELLGVLTSAVFVCITVIVLAKTYGFGDEALPAPQATLMKLVIEGVLERSLPWVLVGIGAALAAVAAALRVPSLPFAVGVYLPVSTLLPLFLGGLLRLVLERASKRRKESEEVQTERRQKGILFGSGLVGGEGLMGVGIAAFALITSQKPAGLGFQLGGSFAPLLAVSALVLLGYLFVRWTRPDGSAPQD